MTDLFQQEPNWMVRTLAGFLLGYFFTHMVKGIHYLWRQVFTKNYLTGQWNSYHQTCENNSRTELKENELSFLLKENTEVDEAKGMIRQK
jgi:hypothetical protein